VHSNRSFKTKPILLLLYSHYGETICDLAQFALKFMICFFQNSGIVWQSETIIPECIHLHLCMWQLHVCQLSQLSRW